MADTPMAPSSQRAAGGQVREALDRLEGLVVDGLKHGFFDYSIACEVGNGGKHHLVIRAGKSHSLRFPLTKCRNNGGFRPAIPVTRTPKMQIEARSGVIGGIPRLETRGTDRREPAVRSSDESIARCERQRH